MIGELCLQSRQLRRAQIVRQQRIADADRDPFRQGAIFQCGTFACGLVVVFRFAAAPLALQEFVSQPATRDDRFLIQAHRRFQQCQPLFVVVRQQQAPGSETGGGVFRVLREDFQIQRTCRRRAFQLLDQVCAAIGVVKLNAAADHLPVQLRQLVARRLPLAVALLPFGQDARAPGIVQLALQHAQPVAQQYLAGTFTGRLGQLRKCADVLQPLAQRRVRGMAAGLFRQRLLQPDFTWRFCHAGGECRAQIAVRCDIGLRLLFGLAHQLGPVVFEQEAQFQPHQDQRVGAGFLAGNPRRGLIGVEFVLACQRPAAGFEIRGKAADKSGQPLLQPRIAVLQTGV